MTVGESVGIMMLAVFSIGLLIVVKQCMGSWRSSLLIILGSCFVALWVGVGAFLITGGE